MLKKSGEKIKTRSQDGVEAGPASQRRTTKKYRNYWQKKKAEHTGR
jgi:hypothetical protein